MDGNVMSSGISGGRGEKLNPRLLGNGFPGFQ